MGRQQAQAVSSLKEALTRRFGETARDVVETHVELRLGGRKGQIERQDLDEIEKSVLVSLRQQRGSSKKGSPLSRSQPLLTGGSQDQMGAFAPTSSKVAPPKLPIGASNPGTLMRAASSGGLSSAAKTKQYVPQPPYGTLVTGGGNEFAQESARSRVHVNPRYPVQKKALSKPTDHWDLIVAFDHAKHKQAEKDWQLKGNHARMAKFKKVLDDQMGEISADYEGAGKRRADERAQMLAQVEENKRIHQAEEDHEQRKKDEQGRINTIMLGAIAKAKQHEKDRAQREQDDMTKWLQTEKENAEEQERKNKIEYARKCARAQEELAQVRADREERRRLDDENEQRLMKLRDQIADENEAKKQKALKDKKDRLDSIEKTMGAAIGDRDAKAAADLEAKIKRVTAEADRLAKEDSQRRRDTFDRKMKDCVTTWDKQMAERAKDDVLTKEEDAKQLDIFKKQLDDGLAADAAKEEKRRLAREEQDKHLISKIRTNAGIHPQHVVNTPRNKKTELGYNAAIFDQMRREGFRPDAVDHLMADPGKDYHPEGKLLHHGSVPRYTGEIHPLELAQPDV